MSRTWRNARAAAAVVAALALALGGCASTAVPAGVAVELVELRTDVATRTLQVRIANGTGAALDVRAVELLDPRLAARAHRDDGTRIPPGRTIDLRLELPAMDCAGTAPSAVVDPRVRIALEGIGIIEVSAPDPAGAVERRHAQECLAEAVAGRAAIEVVGVREGEPGAPAQLRIRLESTGSPGLELVELRPTNLLRYSLEEAGPHQLDRVIAATVDALELEVPLIPQRCDAHAIMEDKRGTVLPLVVEIDGDRGVIELVTPPGIAAEILDWVGRWCTSAAAITR